MSKASTSYYVRSSWFNTENVDTLSHSLPGVITNSLVNDVQKYPIHHVKVNDSIYYVKPNMRILVADKIKTRVVAQLYPCFEVMKDLAKNIKRNDKITLFNVKEDNMGETVAIGYYEKDGICLFPIPCIGYGAYSDDNDNKVQYIPKDYPEEKCMQYGDSFIMLKNPGSYLANTEDMVIDKENMPPFNPNTNRSDPVTYVSGKRMIEELSKVISDDVRISFIQMTTKSDTKASHGVRIIKSHYNPTTKMYNGLQTMLVAFMDPEYDCYMINNYLGQNNEVHKIPQ